MDLATAERLDPGLYSIEWKSGGVSVAAIGMYADGSRSRWVAPTEWEHSAPIARVAPDIECVREIIRQGGISGAMYFDEPIR